MTTAELYLEHARKLLDQAVRAGEAARHAAALGCFLLARHAVEERDRLLEQAAHFESMAHKLAERP